MHFTLSPELQPQYPHLTIDGGTLGYTVVFRCRKKRGPKNTCLIQAWGVRKPGNGTTVTEICGANRTCPDCPVARQ